jgi:Holliday junction DNA helicase RuvA
MDKSYFFIQKGIDMIGYLEGRLLKKENESILLLANQVGYEILLPDIVMQTLVSKQVGEEISLYIYYQQTERQPKPVLIGFNLEAEREFFKRFLSVEAIGPVKAVKALSIPIRDIARAIELKDIDKLQQLKGIGRRTAQKIIATLEGKMEKFAMIRKSDEKSSGPELNFEKQVFEVLVEQLGHKPAEANRMIAEAKIRNPSISAAETLFDEVYRGEMLP